MTAGDRPDYVTCALTGEWDPDGGYDSDGLALCRLFTTWCGRKRGNAEFTFVDASHAALNARDGGRLLLCPECSTQIAAALKKGTWDGSCEEADDEADIDARPEVTALFASIKRALPELRALLDSTNAHWGAEDMVYRFYHQSFKVYWLQDMTIKICDALRAVSPSAPPNDWFTFIIGEGTGKVFKHEHNTRWLTETRPIVEAFFHARYFLEMVVKYGDELDAPPNLMPSGWASVLCLYGLR